MLFKLKKNKNKDIDPEDVFMDSVNLPGFSREKHEGLIEYSLGKVPFMLFRAFIAAGVFFILFQLARLQIIGADSFREKADINQFRVVETDAERGVVYDINGQELVLNIPIFSAYYADKKGSGSADDLRAAAGTLAKRLGVSTEEILVEAGIDSTKPVSETPRELLLIADLPREVVVEIESDPEKYRNIDIQEKILREYPFKGFLSQILGYIGLVSQKDIEKGYGLRDFIGKEGVELVYEDYLKGAKGKKIMEVDAVGRTLRERQFSKPEGGRSALLNIDSGLQVFVYETLKRHIENHGKNGGAVVISDVKDGAIKAIASFPSFDPNAFRGAAAKKELSRILKDPRSPFLNRASSGAYPPGSTFKPFVAVAALNEKIIDPTRLIYDPGYIEIPNPYRPDEKTVFRDWKAFGYVDMKEAIAWSANVYFYTIGGGYENIKGLGIDRIKKYAGFFGLGNKLGIDLSGEVPGLIPDPVWKKENRPKDPVWRIGDTYNASIGQGDVLVTPLQLNFATAAIANGGRLMKPRIVGALLDENKNKIKEFPAEVLHEGFADESAIRTVREAMRRVVSVGSAWALADLPIAVAGKTGTAQTESAIYDQNHAWFTGFAPYENPEIAITVFVEKGGGGATVSVPIAREILEWYFARPK